MYRRNAFCVIRPPGHHAGPNGCVPSKGYHSRPDNCSCGFCLLNNVAIAAAYALYNYGPQRNPWLGSPSPPIIQRIAIIDFDIHHGNGTEAIIRNLIHHKERYPLPSSWHSIEYDSYRPWREENDLENVFFSSIHLYDGDDFYPGSGKGPSGESIELEELNDTIVNIPLSIIGPPSVLGREKLSAKTKKEYHVSLSFTVNFMYRVYLIYLSYLRKGLRPCIEMPSPVS